MSYIYERFNRIAEILNNETLINELFNYLNTDDKKSFVEHIETMYDIAEEDEEEYEDEYQEEDEYEGKDESGEVVVFGKIDTIESLLLLVDLSEIP